MTKIEDGYSHSYWSINSSERQGKINKSRHTQSGETKIKSKLKQCFESDVEDYEEFEAIMEHMSEDPKAQVKKG